VSYYTPGPGDEATWGPITSTSDPRATYFDITFPAVIGIGHVDVEVTAEVWNFGDHPLGEILRVEFLGINIIEALDDSQFQDIEKCYEDWTAKNE